MNESFLHVSDDLNTKREHDYSRQAKAYLDLAYKELGIVMRYAGSDDLALYPLCETIKKYAEACLSLFPCKRQEVRALFLLGMANLNGGSPAKASGFYEEAIAILDDPSRSVRFPDEQHARAELNYLAAGAYSLQLKFRMARQHAEQADAIFRTLTTEAGSIDPGVDLANLSILLTSFFHLAEWSEKDAYFSLARHLAEQAPNAREWYARFDWLEALFYRWNGQLKRAYLLASAGARTLKEIGSPRAVMHLSRLNSVVADIALDLVEFHEDRASSDANTYVSIGQTYAREALELSLQTNHISNKNMALLASARHDGLINCNTNRLFVIENVWKQAEYYKDDTLVAQVYTNLGIEFEAQKERDLAATCYRQAIARTELADIPTMGVLAHRRLRVQQEMYV